MAFKSREKKPFSNCIQGIREEYLRRPVCHDVYGDLNLQQEINQILSKCAERDTIRTRPFCESLGLSKDEESAVIHAAPRSKAQQLRQAVFTWSNRKSDEATLERLLEALYSSDEVELVESICQDLLSMNISDERKAEPQEVYAFDQITTEAIPHKAIQAEVETPSSFDPESGPFIKPVRVSSSGHIKLHLLRQSSDPDLDVVKPVSATDTEHGQLLIPDHPRHDKELHMPSEGRAGSSAIQVQDGALEKSVTFPGETSSPNMLLEARKNRLEKDTREESRKEDKKLRCQIEELKNELQKKDLEIQYLKRELKMEVEQKQEVVNQLDLKIVSSEELKRKVEGLKKQVQERDAQIEILENKMKSVQSQTISVEDDGADCCDGKEYVHSNSDEDTSVVSKGKFEETELLGCGNFGIVSEDTESEARELTKRVDELGLELEAKEEQINQLEKMLSIGEDDQKREANAFQTKPKSKAIDELQTQIVTLTSQNEHKDALIKKLKQELMNKNKNQCSSETNFEGTIGRASRKENTADLNWNLEQSPTGELVVLGSGSYGKVYKGCCKNSGRHLAVKVVLDLTQKAADDLEKEVKQLSELNPHKRIVTYLGACYAEHPRFGEKCLYVFTEFMPGGSLSSCLEKRGPLTQVLTRRYTRQIVEGVDYLHHCKVIHRDIKGSNIMCDTSGNIKLADFGSAKQICSETLDKDKAKYLCGTAPWAAPEVLRGEKAQPHSDIWSVAATVVEMLTGAMPYKTEKFDNSMAIIFQVGGNELNPLKSMKRGGHSKLLTEDTEAFLSRCFKSEAKERPAAAHLLTHFPFCR